MLFSPLGVPTDLTLSHPFCSHKNQFPKDIAGSEHHKLFDTLYQL